jgi:hypothetical protein
MRVTPRIQFPVERRRGWQEASDCPARDPGDIFDQRRNARLIKKQPRGLLTLGVESVGWAGGEWDGDSIEGLRVSYWLEQERDLCPLDDAQWADWDEAGRLLVATRGGRLQIRTIEALDPSVVFEEDLAALKPSPTPPPAWAAQW